MKKKKKVSVSVSPALQKSVDTTDTMCYTSLNQFLKGASKEEPVSELWVELETLARKILKRTGCVVSVKFPRDYLNPTPSEESEW